MIEREGALLQVKELTLLISSCIFKSSVISCSITHRISTIFIVHLAVILLNMRPLIKIKAKCAIALSCNLRKPLLAVV